MAVPQSQHIVVGDKEIELAKGYQDLKIQKKRLEQEEAQLTLKETL